ncbi:MAG TPA: DUF4234 domain-containing protein [Candidatus Saccharimonadales bacterium]|nr:DUF4234 domain-containing protein [Candidatus Saccharimonadales bacterium]
MKERSPIVVLILSIVTLGIYGWYWLVKTKGEMNKRGEHIMTAWIWLIPIIGGIWWLWQYSQGVEHVTNGKFNGILAFVVLWLIGPIGMALVQDAFNHVDKSGMTGAPTGSGPVGPSSGSFGQTQPPVPPVPPTQPPTQPPTPPVPPAPAPPASSTPPSTPIVGAM